MPLRQAPSQLLLVALACTLACAPASPPEPLRSDAINLVLGDRALIEAYGWPLPADLDEDERIRTHLRFVERQLRARPTADLVPALRAAREQNLRWLRDYIHRGEFPRNDDHPDPRRPTFIDARGRICAVGYLLEQALGRAAAETLAARYKYAFIREMDTPLLLAWAATTGLSLEELEMIQPAYAPPPESLHPPMFAALDRIDGRPHLMFASGLLLSDDADGVPVRMDLSMHLRRNGGKRELGFYLATALTKLAGADRSASALANLDLGVSYVREMNLSNRFVFRGSLLLPTGDEDEVGTAINHSVAPVRPSDAVLFQPGAFGARSSASLVLGPDWCADIERNCFFRLDAGLDAYNPFSDTWRLAPRWGAGLAYRYASFAMTLEATGSGYPRPATGSRVWAPTVGGSLQMLLNKHWQSAVSVLVPLSTRDRGWLFGLALVVLP